MAPHVVGMRTNNSTYPSRTPQRHGCTKRAQRGRSMAVAGNNNEVRGHDLTPMAQGTVLALPAYRRSAPTRSRFSWCLL